MDGSARNEQRFPDGRIVALSAAGRLGLQRQERLLDVGEVRLDGLFSYAVFMDLRPGAKEIGLAVSENFGGWGFAARLEPLGPDEPERP